MTTRPRPLTIADLPLFATDEQIGEAVLGWERRGEFFAFATLLERKGMPSISMTGGRYVPAVRAFLDIYFGLSPAIEARPPQRGMEGPCLPSRRGRRASA